MANKLEGDKWVDTYDGHSSAMSHLHEAASIGFGEAIPISAEHGEGIADIATILHHLTEMKRKRLGLLENSFETKKADEKPLNFAVLGRQNVGKSTLVNALLKRERVITGEKAGLTRDAIACEWKYKGRPVKVVDTVSNKMCYIYIQHSILLD